jgi:hypothetical protein
MTSSAEKRLRLVLKQLRKNARQGRNSSGGHCWYENRIAAKARARAYERAAKMVEACL